MMKAGNGLREGNHWQILLALSLVFVIVIEIVIVVNGSCACGVIALHEQQSRLISRFAPRSRWTRKEDLGRRVI